MRFCHGANVAEQVSHVNEGSRCCAITVTSPSSGGARKRLTCPAETSRKIEMSMRHATLRWRYAGLPSARVL